MVAESKPNKLR